VGSSPTSGTSLLVTIYVDTSKDFFLAPIQFGDNLGTAFDLHWDCVVGSFLSFGENFPMATLESRNGWYRVVIRLDGEKYSRSLKTKDNISAQRCLAKIKDNLHRLEMGSLELPERCRDPLDFLLGAKNQTPKLPDVPIKASTITIQKAWDRFKSLIPEGSLETETLKGMEIHVRHLRRLIGVKTKLGQIDKSILQQYIDDRSKEPGQNDRLLSPETIKKELRTLSTIWGWMIEEKLVQHAFPNLRLRYPKRTVTVWRHVDA